MDNFWNTRDYAKHEFGSGHHDTIGMIVIDRNKNVAAGTNTSHITTNSFLELKILSPIGTSTNGARHKIPG